MKQLIWLLFSLPSHDRNLQIEDSVEMADFIFKEEIYVTKS